MRWQHLPILKIFSPRNYFLRQRTFFCCTIKIIRALGFDMVPNYIFSCGYSVPPRQLLSAVQLFVVAFAVLLSLLISSEREVPPLYLLLFCLAGKHRKLFFSKAGIRSATNFYGKTLAKSRQISMIFSTMRYESYCSRV